MTPAMLELLRNNREEDEGRLSQNPSIGYVSAGESDEDPNQSNTDSENDY